MSSSLTCSRRSIKREIWRTYVSRDLGDSEPFVQYIVSVIHHQDWRILSWITRHMHMPFNRVVYLLEAAKTCNLTKFRVVLHSYLHYWTRRYNINDIGMNEVFNEVLQINCGSKVRNYILTFTKSNL